jgi:salicylate hydroxylase
MPAAAREALARHAWREELARVGDGWRRWPLLTVAADAPWCNGRVALTGDAAHAMLPFMAQGGAMAIEDAAVLAAMIARHGAGPAALAAYEAARKPRVARVARESARTGRIYHLAPPLSLARDAAMRALGPRRLLARLDWLYGWRPAPPG